jgi:endo-1,4-beta-xylanase
MKITRRETLALAMALATAGCSGEGAQAASPATPTPVPPRPPPPTSLNALARAKGMRFGSTVSSGDAQSGSFRNSRYAALLEADCGLLVPENEMKWQSIRPAPGKFDFVQFDEQVSYAQSKGLAIRGHNLLWNRPQWMPGWLETYDFGANPATEAARLMTEHIATVCTRYRGKVLSYDVVNEAVLPEDGTLASTAISRAMGGSEALLDLAFHTARQQAPDAQLVYNDYMSWEPGNETHRAGVLKLLEGFKKRNVPVDALGVQSHIRIDTYDPATGTSPRQEREWRAFLDSVTAMGYALLITEFDVNDQALPADVASRDRSVADYAKAYLDLMFSYPQLKDALVWGMCDGYSWLQSFEPLRADGQPKRPCPYAADFGAKPMRSAIANAFVAAPSR